ncbi:MAG: hypothetical protein ACTTI4_00580 [Prevotella fusca]|uniref:hypothetical protein n=1 Tax=Prevotella fusca TaxID=589436 RepID=UPI003F9ED877
MEISIAELGGIIADFVRVGYNSAIKDYEPAQDLLRKSEVKKWLKFRNIEYKQFQSLVEKGLIHARKGNSVNSPLYYSKAEIQKAFATMRVNKIFVNDKIERL